MAIEAGGNAFLPKPVNASVLFRLMAEQLSLEWIYQEGGATREVEAEASIDAGRSLSLPNPETLEALLTLAQQGRLKQLETQVQELLDANQVCSGFANSVLTLVQQYAADELEALLEQYLQASQDEELSSVV